MAEQVEQWILSQIQKHIQLLNVLKNLGNYNFNNTFHISQKSRWDRNQTVKIFGLIKIHKITHYISHATLTSRIFITIYVPNTEYIKVTTQAVTAYKILTKNINMDYRILVS